MKTLWGGRGDLSWRAREVRWPHRYAFIGAPAAKGEKKFERYSTIGNRTWPRTEQHFNFTSAAATLISLIGIDGIEVE